MNHHTATTSFPARALFTTCSASIVRTDGRGATCFTTPNTGTPAAHAGASGVRSIDWSRS